MTRIILPPRLEEERRRELADLEARHNKFLEELEDEFLENMNAIIREYEPTSAKECWLNLGIVVAVIAIIVIAVRVLS